MPFTELVEVNPRASVARRGSVPFIGMEDVSEDGRLLRIRERPIAELAPGQPSFRNHDVLFAKITPCMENGKGAYVTGMDGEVGLGSTEFHVLRARPGTEPRFVYHWTRSCRLRQAAEAMMTGSAGQRRVSKEFFTRFRIPLLEQAEQRRIAEILDTIDEQIRAAERLVGKLEDVYASIVRDQLARISDCVSSTVGALFDMQPGITLGPHRKPRKNAHGYLRVANVQRGFIDLSDVASLEASLDDRQRWALQTGDLLVVEGHASPDEIGRCAMVDRDSEGLLYQNHLFRLRTRSIIPEFGLLWLNSDAVRSYWRKMCATSSGLYTINGRMLSQMPFPVPTLEQQLHIVRIHADLTAKIKQERSRLAKLRLLKQGLMDDLLTGRVRVPVGAGDSE